jgi:hypothetical protein
MPGLTGMAGTGKQLTVLFSSGVPTHTGTSFFYFTEAPLPVRTAGQPVLSFVYTVILAVSRFPVDYTQGIRSGSSVSLSIINKGLYR